jgi:hypothetical protein
MGILSSFRKQRAKRRIAQDDRGWRGSARKKTLEAERNLPPRPLSPDEHELLRWILEHGSEAAKTFLPQAEGVRAVRSCICGCPSIRLVVRDGVPLGVSQSGRVISDLWGRTEKGELVGVLLFQDDGIICELEAYSMDGEVQDDGNEYEFPTIQSLRELEAGEPPAPNHS